MIKFETKIQYFKYQALLNVAKLAWKERLVENVLDIPKMILPNKDDHVRCCIYKDRAILQERVKLAMGGNRNIKNIVEVIDIACDECPIGGYEVTNTCRGCLAQRCVEACKKNAIYFDQNRQAHIDKSKCINCGLCAKACPYSAVINRNRPCENACAVNAIEANEAQAAHINEDKCINCGNCISQCPFGAISDKSFILDAIDYILKSDNNKNYKVYALVAPAIVDGFKDVKYGQIITGLKELGFADVFEVASGADMVANSEAKELSEKGFLLSSCCPAFVDYVKKNFPEFVDAVSSNLSPMATLGKYIKSKQENCKLIFIGPCTAKKAEIMKEEVRDYIDVVLTFEELAALFESKDIDVDNLKESDINNASYFGRVFARSGGLTEAMKQGLKENNCPIEYKPETCSGIEECRIALLKKSKSLLDANFLEGMACNGGCINGAGVIQKYNANSKNIDKYAKDSDKKDINDSIKTMDKTSF